MMPNTPSTALLPGTELPFVELSAMGAEDFDSVARWIGAERARVWLDLGSGRQELPRRQLYMMLIGQHSHARLFRLPNEPRPLGLVALRDVNDLMGSAEAWVIRDLSVPSPRNVSAAACVRIFANGFLDLNRHLIHSWHVDCNRTSLRLHELVGMRRAGTLRQRHLIGGQRRDRWLYDMTRDEFGQRYPDVPSERGQTFGNQATRDPVEQRT